MRELHYHPDNEALLQEREEFVTEVFELCFGIFALPSELNTSVHEDRRPSFSYDEALERLKELDKHAYLYEEEKGLL
jgi:hypothetical protein